MSSGPNRTPEQRERVLENINRADCLGGAIEALNVAVEFEEDEGYARYLDTVVREFLEEESAGARSALREYLVELFAQELETLG